MKSKADGYVSAREYGLVVFLHQLICHLLSDVHLRVAESVHLMIREGFHFKSNPETGGRTSIQVYPEGWPEGSSGIFYFDRGHLSPYKGAILHPALDLSFRFKRSAARCEDFQLGLNLDEASEVRLQKIKDKIKAFEKSERARLRREGQPRAPKDVAAPR